VKKIRYQDYLPKKVNDIYRHNSFCHTKCFYLLCFLLTGSWSENPLQLALSIVLSALTLIVVKRANKGTIKQYTVLIINEIFKSFDFSFSFRTTVSQIHVRIRRSGSNALIKDPLTHKGNKKNFFFISKTYTVIAQMRLVIQYSVFR